MKFLRYTASVLSNKYLLTLAVFIAWMLFFDRNDLFTQMERKRNLKQIEADKDLFAKKIAEGKKFSLDMQSNTDAVEKFVREKYLMKRDNEDLFLIRKPEKE